MSTSTPWQGHLRFLTKFVIFTNKKNIDLHVAYRLIYDLHWFVFLTEKREPFASLAPLARNLLLFLFKFLVSWSRTLYDEYYEQTYGHVKSTKWSLPTHNWLELNDFDGKRETFWSIAPLALNNLWKCSIF